MMVSCSTCSKTFTCSYDLKRHIRRYHLARMLTCYHCNYETKQKSNLAGHIQALHLPKKKVRPVSRLFNCILCPSQHYEIHSREGMFDHYIKIHDVPIQPTNLEFSTWTEFEEWKKGIEQADVCRYVSRTGPKNPNGKKCRTYYYCFRDGIFKTKSHGHRHLKMRGSIKIDGVCPASIRTKEDKVTGTILVSYVHTHVGHEREVGRLNLSKSERADIAPTFLSDKDINEKRLMLRNRFNELLEHIRSDDHVNILLNALRPVLPTIEANSSLQLKSSIGAVAKNPLKNISPQKRFYSTKNKKKKKSFQG